MNHNPYSMEDINDIVLNQNCINNVRYTVKNGPILSKKYSPNSVSV